MDILALMTFTNISQDILKLNKTDGIPLNNWKTKQKQMEYPWITWHVTYQEISQESKTKSFVLTYTKVSYLLITFDIPK